MLDAEIKSQLSQVFAALIQPVDLVYDLSTHSKQNELVDMLEEIATTNDHIKAKPSHVTSEAPRFRITRNGNPTGVQFQGIPGGHEFTSLILAILHSNGLGKMPDAGLVSRIQNLKGPIRIRTYISLTCENCPDVVQALNQMALIHPDFEHEMIDGSFVPDEVSRLGIQGVPSVVVDSKMIHSGRIHFLDLLVKLESVFGTHSNATRATQVNLGHFDTVVIGGGPAGISAAIYSARKGMKTAVVAERIGGQVQDTKGIENLISVIYTEGPMLADQLYKHLSHYPVKILDQRRVKSITHEKSILLESGETLSGDAIIIASGAQWRELGVPGERDYVGRGVAYCPHCDGPFYQGKKIAVIGGGNSGVEAAIDLAGIAGELIVFEFNDSLKADQILVNKLNSLPNVTVVTNAKTKELIGNGQKITDLVYVDRKTEQEVRIPIDGVFVQIGLIPNSGFAREVVELSKYGEILIDQKGHTNIPGIYAAGDVANIPFKQIIIAMGEGAKVALSVFEDRMFRHNEPLLSSVKT